MNKTFRIIALLTALVLCLSFAACGGKDKDTETTTAAPVEEGSYSAVTAALPDLDTTEAAPTTAAAVDVDATGEDASAVAEESSAPVSETTTAAAGVAQPTTPGEIVALFNSSANAVRTDKPGYTCNVTNYVKNITVHDSRALQSIANTALNFINADPTANTVAKGASHNDFGCSSTKYASALDVKSVSKATCTKAGNSYKIRIDLKSESLNDLPSQPLNTNTGKAMLVLNANEVYEQTDKIPGVTMKKFAPTYSGCYIECTIDATTGRMSACTYYWNSDNAVEAGILGGSASADVNFAIKRAYKINY